MNYLWNMFAFNHSQIYQYIKPTESHSALRPPPLAPLQKTDTASELIDCLPQLYEVLLVAGSEPAPSYSGPAAVRIPHKLVNSWRDLTPCHIWSTSTPMWEYCFIDFSSAFDNIIPSQLKLHLPGLNTSSWNFFLDFLSGRFRSPDWLHQLQHCHIEHRSPP